MSTMSDSGPIVGIDLGTTNSAMAVFQHGTVRVIPNALGDDLTPSVVALDKRNSGALLVGRTAKDIYAVHPELGAATFKRGMGTDLQYSIAGARYSSIELSAMVLEALRADAVRELGPGVDRCVITVPAYFNEAQRFATRKAGEIAGWIVERILNEPTAAAISHGAHRGVDGTLLVVDLGGGTFDVCVMDRFEGALMVRSVAGESMLGGEDFTRRLVSLVLSTVGVPFERAEMTDVEAIALLTKRCELAKRKLTDEASARVRVPVIRKLLETEREVEVTREALDEAFESLIDRLRGPCRAALRGAQLNRTDMDDVILVGGATRMPAIHAFARQMFEREPLDGVDPDLAVVHGAAIQGALIGDDVGVDDMVVTDVASHSLGTMIVKEYGSRRVPGFFLPIIHRNSVIPTSRSEVLHTIDANQKGMTIEVYEGESRMAQDNRQIGELVVKGIPAGPAGQGVKVTFTYDLDGILEVEAVVEATGKSFRKIFSRSSKSLSPGEIKAAEARLKKIKRDPREAPAIRDLLARADLLIREVDPGNRRLLEQAIDFLEDALANRDPGSANSASGCQCRSRAQSINMTLLARQSLASSADRRRPMTAAPCMSRRRSSMMSPTAKMSGSIRTARPSCPISFGGRKRRGVKDWRSFIVQIRCTPPRRKGCPSLSWR